MERKYLTLDDLNLALKSYNYGYSNMDTKPNIIYEGKNSYVIKQKGINFIYLKLSIASQMRTLIRFLPSIIGEFIPVEDNHWECLLLLWDICSKCNKI